ncbi:hypothetical protein DFH09DRAFT_1352772 [Mycena vulgaris]|nr:hypothetical protein DFH09DRAFT_1352772 [Mycena vulgaris]
MAHTRVPGMKHQLQFHALLATPGAERIAYAHHSWAPEPPAAPFSALRLDRRCFSSFHFPSNSRTSPCFDSAPLTTLRPQINAPNSKGTHSAMRSVGKMSALHVAESSFKSGVSLYRLHMHPDVDSESCCRLCARNGLHACALVAVHCASPVCAAEAVFTALNPSAACVSTTSPATFKHPVSFASSSTANVSRPTPMPPLLNILLPTPLRIPLDPRRNPLNDQNQRPSPSAPAPPSSTARLLTRADRAPGLPHAPRARGRRALRWRGHDVAGADGVDCGASWEAVRISASIPMTSPDALATRPAATCAPIAYPGLEPPLSPDLTSSVSLTRN